MAFTSIRTALQMHNPLRISPGGCHEAAVAMLLCDLDKKPKMFFIQRALHEQDPWSGQVAFPGGSRDPGDADTLYTAQRETMEEVGICLDDCSLLGQLDDQKSFIEINSKPIVINCYVFEVSGIVSPKNSDEVHCSFWIQLDHLTNPVNRMTHQMKRSNESRPAVKLEDGKVLWGLTYRFVNMLIHKIGLDSGADSDQGSA